MISIAIIYLREFLEISLIVGMVIGATKDIPNRIPYILWGISFGILGSVLFAYTFNFISKNIDDEIEDIFTSLILLINVVLIIYTIFWMENYSKKISYKVKEITDNIKSSKLPLYTISFIITFTIIREGIEIVLFSYGIVFSNKLNILQAIVSIAIGSVTGILIGYIAYFSIVKLPIKFFFKVTTILLMLFAANLASQIPIYLESANIISIFSSPIWDSSWLINSQSLIGKILHSLIGYSDKPTLMQFIFYCSTIITIFVFRKHLLVNKYDKNHLK